jgi:hypothetical protein
VSGKWLLNEDEWPKKNMFPTYCSGKSIRNKNNTDNFIRSVLFGASEHFHENSREGKVPPQAGADS